ncbi:MAG: molybdopterin-dependent oxidoreductase [Alphaproteobacteria bacterium]
MRKPATLDPPGFFRRIPLLPHQLHDAITPTRDFFGVAHLGIPRIDAESWTLDIAGLVERPFSLTLAALRTLPKREVQSIHECAGYPRNPALATRRIANVVWGGVDLRDLLCKAGVQPNATHLWSHGLDHGAYDGTETDAYVKDMPLSRLAEGGVLVAYEVNRETLPREHGFPARLVVPGYYGTNAVKWLWRLEVADRRAPGPFTTVFYNDPLPATDADPSSGTQPVWEVAPESVIVAPAPAQTVVGSSADIWGWAWAASGVREVVVSADAGRTWNAAELESRRDWSWQRFRLTVRHLASGPTTLLSRATDNNGVSQPDAGARNSVHAVEVRVRPAPRPATCDRH